MARRRLTPVDADAWDVPRAEHLPEPPGRPGAAAPIARVAADAAGSAAAEELAAVLATARATGRLVLDLPLDAIAPDHLTRDRIPLEDPEMAALRASLRAHGQRVPIEVTPLQPPGAGGTGTLPYGLISGWRRLEALKALHAETGEARFATVQALVRRPETAEAAYVAMVEENEIRVGLSHYERARVAALATRRGVFPTEKTALLALFATASRPKRSRIRAFLELYHALDGALRFPAQLPERLGLRLVERLRAGGGPALAAALAAAAPETAAAELALLETLARPAKTPSPTRPGRALAPGLMLEETLAGRTLTLRLKGSAVTPALRDRVRAALAALAAEPGPVPEPEPENALAPAP